MQTCRRQTDMADIIAHLNKENGHTGEYFEETTKEEDDYLRAWITSYLPDLHITRTCAVKNNYLLAMYELKKAEYEARYGASSVQEKRMLHATCESNVHYIIRDNLNWRRVNKGVYGKGISFSEDADYCNFYCSWYNGPHRVFIVADVLICNETLGRDTMDVPPEGVDTTVGNCRRVFVKFNDNEFLPKYLVFYEEPERTESKYFDPDYFNRRR